MPSPLPPLKPRLEAERLSFIPRHGKAKAPDAGGTPVVAWIIQLFAEFDPILGDGHWEFTQYPTKVPFDDYEQFERFCRQHLPIPKESFSELMDYIHNFKVVNVDLRTGEVYPVIPRPSGFNVPIPIAGAPGNYLG